MTPLSPPENLPESFREIWSALADAERQAATRQDLGRRLRVSTGTLQRILVSGDVPQFACASTRVTHAWTRTITRIAHALGRDARSWIEAVGIPWTQTTREICNIEKDKAKGASRATANYDLQRAIGHAFTSALARRLEFDSVADCPHPVDDRVWMAIQEMLGAGSTGYSHEPPAEGVSGDEPAANRDRAHCRSCLADLRLDENRGASDSYCRYCSDSSGRLRPRDEVHRILAAWLSDLQGGLADDDAKLRAEHYMLAMPAWAPDGP